VSHRGGGRSGDSQQASRDRGIPCDVDRNIAEDAVGLGCRLGQDVQRVQSDSVASWGETGDGCGPAGALADGEQRCPPHPAPHRHKAG